MYNSDKEENKTILNTPKSRNWKNVLVVLMTSLAAYCVLKKEFRGLTYIDYGPFEIFSHIWYGFLKLVVLFVLVYSIVHLVKSKRIIHVITLIITLSTVIAVSVIWVKIERRDSSTKILEAYYDGDLNGLRLILRSNNTYKIDDSGVLGGTSCFGKYTISNNIINLSEKFPLGKDRDIMGDKLLVARGEVLIKRDANGLFTDNRFRMKILYSHESLRTK